MQILNGRRKDTLKQTPKLQNNIGVFRVGEYVNNIELH